MKYYYMKATKNSTIFEDAGKLLYDGKNAFAVWTWTGYCIEYSADGLATWAGEKPRHADAVEIRPDMTEKEIRNARRIAATRETLRTYEERADAILEKGDAMTAADRLALLALVNVAYHDSGKIEGCFSVDGCAACDFCQRMIAAAADNVLMICGCCYAAADAYKEASWRRHKLNARILSSVLFTVDELKTLDKLAAAETVRFNEDGDTVNETHARNLLRIGAKAFPDADYGYWYKNAAAVKAGLHAEGYHAREQLPKNIRFIHSSPLIGFPVQACWFDDDIFTVYPDAATTAEAIKNGAHACNGRRCRECKYHCYKSERQPEPRHVAEFLRCSSARRAVIMAAYDARRTQQERRTV